MRRLISSARDTTVAFVLASVGTLLGTAVAWVLLSQQLGQGGWQVSTGDTYSCVNQASDHLSPCRGSMKLTGMQLPAA